MKGKQVMSHNLKAYFSYLEKNGWREAMAHFANMFAGKSYPNSLMFIIQNTPDLYKEVTRFVGEIR